VGEQHTVQLVPAFELFGAIVTVVFIDDTLKFIARKKAQVLRCYPSGKDTGIPGVCSVTK
jgi:hypothetical protein